eukprot:g537.t1
MAKLAESLRCGKDGVKMDWSKAMMWAEMAAQKNEPQGWYIAGLMMFYGMNGIKRDRSKALDYMFRSLESGNLPYECCAYGYIGESYIIGGDGVKTNPELAMKWFQRIIDEKRYGTKTLAHLYLAKAYQSGVGQKKNLKLAREYYKMTVNSPDFLKYIKSLHCAIIYYDYAKMLMKGLGGKQDPLNAIKWLQRSAELENKDAIKVLKKMKTVWK